MPVSVRRSPFRGKPTEPPPPKLRTPQARCLAALQPESVDTPPIDWPVVTRAQLAVRAGYTAISGTVTRALNGIRPGSTSDKHTDGRPGDGHPGLLALGLVAEEVFDIEGTKEVNYRATPAGVRAYRAYLLEQGGAPPVRDAAKCINDRYKKSEQKPENVT